MLSGIFYVRKALDKALSSHNVVTAHCAVTTARNVKSLDMTIAKNKHKLLLIRPLIRGYVNSQSAEQFETSIGLVPPLNLCCLAAVIEDAGYPAAIYDCEAKGNSEEQLINYLRAAKPDIVGISIITTNFHGALLTAKIVKQVLPQATVICGGSHMLIFPRETFTYNEFDFGFVGEAEAPLVDFLKLIKNKTQKYAEIPGLVWRDEEKVIMNEPFGFNENLDLLPAPAYHLLDLSSYHMPNTKGNVVSLFLSRGCPFKCGFCFRSPLLQKVRYKSVDKAIDEIESITKRFDIKSINFVDETISLRKEYFLDFCKKLRAKKLSVEWQSPTRANFVDEEIVRAAKQAGCHTFRFGIESGSQEILKKIDKGIDLAQSRQAVSLCRKYGIKTVAYFIIGYLGETEGTIRQTIKFARELKPNYAAFFPATPMPATELYKESEEKGLVPKDYWRDFVLGKRSDALPFVFPDAGVWVIKAYKSFYFSPRYILKQMKTAAFYKNFFKNLKLALNLFLMKFKRG